MASTGGAAEAHTAERLCPGDLRPDRDAGDLPQELSEIVSAEGELGITGLVTGLCLESVAIIMHVSSKGRSLMSLFSYYIGFPS